MDFIQDNPDFAPKAKRTISRIEFYKWLVYFGNFDDKIKIEEGRSRQGRLIMYKTKSNEEKEKETQPVIEGLEF